MQGEQSVREPHGYRNTVICNLVVRTLNFRRHVGSSVGRTGLAECNAHRGGGSLFGVYMIPANLQVMDSITSYGLQASLACLFLVTVDSRRSKWHNSSRTNSKGCRGIGRHSYAQRSWLHVCVRVLPRNRQCTLGSCRVSVRFATCGSVRKDSHGQLILWHSAR